MPGLLWISCICIIAAVTPEEIAACPPELFGEFHLCDVPHITFPDGHRELAAEGRSYRLWPGESGLDLTKWLEVIPDTAVIMPEIPNQDRNALYGQFEYNVVLWRSASAITGAHGSASDDKRLRKGASRMTDASMKR